MKISLSIVSIIILLGIGIESKSQLIPTDSSKNFVRLSVFTPSLSWEHSISPWFSINGGVGLGYFIKRKNYYDYTRKVMGETIIESIHIDYPILRLNYPASMEAVDPNEDPPSREGEAAHYLKPYVDLEARFYVNKKLRSIKEKSIANNSANYLNVAAAYYFDGLQFYKVYYGLQRNMKAFWLDWSIGPGVSTGDLHSGLFIQGSIKIGWRLYKF